MAEAVVCGPGARRYVEKIEKAEQAGYTHVCLHQVGPEQEGFIDFCERELLPAFAARPSSRSATPRREGENSAPRRGRTKRKPAA